MREGLKTPVVLIIFNRPDVTQAVFERIAAVKPRTLLVIADGPREGRQGEAESCRLARQIVERVNWPCEVLRNYSETNMGCGRRVASGIDWVFQNVEDAIILEDDCLPDPTFFPFCAELLERYRDDERIMQVSGTNFLFGRRPTDASYYFSRYPLCWGWATWRRAWAHFDFEVRAWKKDPAACLAHFDVESERAFWRSAWDSIARGRPDIWDYHWSLAFLVADGLAATPSVNLVTNIGFGSDATHTRSRLLAMRPAVGTVRFPLRHPPQTEANATADRFTARRLFYQRSKPGKAVEILVRRSLAALSHARAGSRGTFASPQITTPAGHEQ